jgi:hypothetical protein
MELPTVIRKEAVALYFEDPRARRPKRRVILARFTVSPKNHEGTKITRRARRRWEGRPFVAASMGAALSC